MKILKNKSTILFLAIVLLLIFTPAFYFFSKYQNTKKQLEDSKYLQKKERETLLDKVGAHILLPTDEQPTIASVSDKKRLSSQPFFAKVENGDQILIYSKAKKAIIYRPSLDKIIEVGPISIGEGL